MRIAAIGIGLAGGAVFGVLLMQVLHAASGSADQVVFTTPSGTDFKTGAVVGIAGGVMGAVMGAFIGASVGRHPDHRGDAPPEIPPAMMPPSHMTREHEPADREAKGGK